MGWVIRGLIFSAVIFFQSPPSVSASCFEFLTFLNQYNESLREAGLAKKKNSKLCGPVCLVNLFHGVINRFKIPIRIEDSYKEVIYITDELSQELYGNKLQLAKNGVNTKEFIPIIKLYFERKGAALQVEHIKKFNPKFVDNELHRQDSFYIFAYSAWHEDDLSAVSTKKNAFKVKPSSSLGSHYQLLMDVDASNSRRILLFDPGAKPTSVWNAKLKPTQLTNNGSKFYPALELIMDGYASGAVRYFVTDIIRVSKPSPRQ